MGVSADTPGPAKVRRVSLETSKTEHGVLTGGAECEKHRKRCVESCANYRKACDEKHPDDSQYCIEQQN